MKLKNLKLKVMRKLLILLLIFPLITIAQEKTTWDYPVKPGSKEWEKLETYQDRLNVYNIPENLLENIKTEELVKICLNYPEFRLLMTRNSLQEGYAYLKSIFNGFVELEKRKDAGTYLVLMYSKLKPRDIQNYDDLIEQGRFSFKFTYIEILLAQKNILRKMNNETKNLLLKRGISNYEQKSNLPEYYGTFGLKTPSLMLGRFLDINDYQMQSTYKKNERYLKDFINHSILHDQSSLQLIIDRAKGYENQLRNE